MAERSKAFSPTATLAGVNASTRLVASPTRASNSLSRRPMEREGNFPPCKASKCHKTGKLLPRHPAARLPALPRSPAPSPPRRGRACSPRSTGPRFRLPPRPWRRAPRGLIRIAVNSAIALGLPAIGRSSPRSKSRFIVFGRRLQPDRVEMVSSISRLSYRHLSLFLPRSENAHIRRMSLQAVAL